LPDRFHKKEFSTFVWKNFEGGVVLYNFEPFVLFAQQETTLIELVR